MIDTAAGAAAGPLWAAARGLTPERATTLFWGFVLAHAALWTLLPGALNANVPLDIIESVVWGHEWQLGYHKHPPLSAWLSMIAATLSGNADWAQYLLSQICVAVAFWAVWRLARDMTGHAEALLSVLLLEGVHYFSYTSPEFNPNVNLLPLWALTILAFWRALTGGRHTIWLVLGALGGVAVLTKYFAVFLLLSMGLLMLGHRPFRRQLSRPGPYLALLAFAAVVSPHLWWVFDSDFTTLGYGVGRAGASSSGDWLDHIVYPPRFLFGQAWIVLPAVAMLLALGRPRRRRVDDHPGDADRSRFLLALAFGPPAIVAVVSAIMGWKIRSMWGTPLFALSGILMVLYLAPPVSRWRLDRFTWAVAAVVSLMAAAYIGTYALAPIAGDRGKRTQFPGLALAERIEAGWRQRFDAPLGIVAGDIWNAGNVAYYAAAAGYPWPSVMIDGDPAASPWLSLDDVSRRGAVIVWDADRLGEAMPERLRRRFPGAERQDAMALRWQVGPTLPELRIGWAVVPPAGG